MRVRREIGIVSSCEMFRRQTIFCHFSRRFAVVDRAQEESGAPRPMKMGTIAFVGAPMTRQSRTLHHRTMCDVLRYCATGDNFLCVVDHPVTISMAAGGSIP